MPIKDKDLDTKKQIAEIKKILANDQKKIADLTLMVVKLSNSLLSLEYKVSELTDRIDKSEKGEK